MELNGLSLSVAYLVSWQPQDRGVAQLWAGFSPGSLWTTCILCSEVIPQWPRGKSKEGEVCSCVAPLSGFRGCATRRPETSGVWM